MIHTDEYDHKYYLSMGEASQDGLSPVRVWSVLQFFSLTGKKSVLSKDNLIPIPDLQYCVLARYPGGDRYFTRTFKSYSINQLYFYRKDLDFSGVDTAIENLRRYVDDGRITLLLTVPQIEATQELLKRLYKSRFKTEGKLDYRLYLKILQESLDYEDYRDVGKSLTGFRTVCNEFEKRITELWKQAK